MTFYYGRMLSEFIDMVNIGDKIIGLTDSEIIIVIEALRKKNNTISFTRYKGNIISILGEE